MVVLEMLITPLFFWKWEVNLEHLIPSMIQTFMSSTDIFQYFIDEEIGWPLFQQIKEPSFQFVFVWTYSIGYGLQYFKTKIYSRSGLEWEWSSEDITCGMNLSLTESRGKFADGLNKAIIPLVYLLPNALF